MEKENILLWRRRTEENIWREKNHFFGGKEKTEKEKEENVWRRKKYFFVEVMKNTDGKGGKYHGEGKIVADGWTDGQVKGSSIGGPKKQDNERIKASKYNVGMQTMTC